MGRRVKENVNEQYKVQKVTLREPSLKKQKTSNFVNLLRSVESLKLFFCLRFYYHGSTTTAEKISPL